MKWVLASLKITHRSAIMYKSTDVSLLGATDYKYLWHPGLVVTRFETYWFELLLCDVTLAWVRVEVEFSASEEIEYLLILTLIPVQKFNNDWRTRHADRISSLNWLDNFSPFSAEKETVCRLWLTMLHSGMGLWRIWWWWWWWLLLLLLLLLLLFNVGKLEQLSFKNFLYRFYFFVFPMFIFQINCYSDPISLLFRSIVPYDQKIWNVILKVCANGVLFVINIEWNVSRVGFTFEFSWGNFKSGLGLERGPPSLVRTIG